MRTDTVKGTNDYLPREAELRDFLQTTILNVYRHNGFEQIMTPAIEDIENLDKSDGGENLNLIFNILKRGDKLEKALQAGEFNNLADLGLRYDLTLPLSRCYAKNKDQLMLPFKCIQIDKVYRAERPQKGRLREFLQCDIDIIGSSSLDCEIELIHVTALALLAIGVKNFRMKVNDRRLLASLLKAQGFEQDQLDTVCITFDKLDKIGLDGVEEELKAKELPDAAIASFCSLLQKLPLALEDLTEILPGEPAIDDLKCVINTVEQMADGQYGIYFDLSLTRGQGYYTGTVFEIESIDFKGSIGGGGRYDNLIGKFLNTDIPAVGFSIGFERIFSILSAQNATLPQQKPRIAVVYEDFLQGYQTAEELRAQGKYQIALFAMPDKLGKFLARLEKYGYSGYVNAAKSAEVRLFE